MLLRFLGEIGHENGNGTWSLEEREEWKVREFRSNIFQGLILFGFSHSDVQWTVRGGVWGGWVRVQRRDKVL